MGYAVFVGDVALDEYYRADYWPSIQDKAIVRALPAVPGGMIANAACVAAALGLEVKFLAMLNSGAITQLLLADLQKSGVDTSLVLFDDTLPDAKCLIFLVADEHTVLIPTMGITHIDITPAQLEVLAQAELIYSTPVEFDLLRCGAMDSLAIIDYCRARGAKMVYDLDVDYLQDGADERFRHLENIRIPPELDYGTISAISYEVREKLKRFKPATLGQANRISGVTPAAISVLMIYLRKYFSEKRNN